ncbi:dockerin [Roseateles sp. BYS78W]|uniref:Dockerin n=1 Tax=Pelomonas candidula TaxID=3299025 RepID=A0ABW7HEY8_9BURK
MRFPYSTLLLAMGASVGLSAQAQSCGSGGGTTVCLAAGGVANGVQLNWTASGIVNGLEIYRNTSADPNGRVRVASVAKSTTSYADATAANGTQYWYWVRFTTNAGSYNSGSAAATGGNACAPTALTPYISVNGTATQTASANIKPGASAVLSPRPLSGGLWSWSGCGTAGASREQTITPTAACTATATYTNSCGAKSQQAFSIKVGNWASVKFGGGGYVTGLIFHPTTKDLLYARTDVGGAYRWDQATTSWVAITDGFSAAEGFHHGVESLALDPTNDQLVYMVTGVSASTDATARLYISSNRGDSWTHVDLPFSAGANNLGRAIGERLMVDPNKPSTLFFGSRTAGLWRSTDSGRTWAQVSSLSSTKMTTDQFNSLGGQAIGVELVVYDTGTKGSGTATQSIYAAVAPDYANLAGLGGNLYKSTNGGASWSAVTTPVSGYHIPHMVRAADGVFYVLFTKGRGPGDSGPGRLYKFDGSTWTLLSSIDYAGYGGLSVSGTGSSTRIALGVSGTWGNYPGQQIVQLSDDGGRTWREIEGGMPGQTASGWVDDVEIDPFNRDHVLHVHGGGIVETRTASSSRPTWNSSVNGLEETCTLGLRTPPAGAPYVFINSSGDVGTWVHTDLTQTPTRNPYKQWSSGNSADTAWSDPTYIAAGGVVNNSSGAQVGAGYWSGDGGQTWASFAKLPPGAADHTDAASNLAVTARNKVVWAPADSVPSYTSDSGASWTATNLGALSSVGIPRSYRMVADRKNPNKVYAYDSGGAWWTYTQAKVYVSTDGGHSFAVSPGSVSANMRFAPFGSSSMAVNPNAEGDLWVADGLALYHSLDSGATWNKLNTFAPIWNGRQDWFGPEVAGASIVALGKPKAGAGYSAAVYVVGVINNLWGVWRSDDGGATWQRHNDDAHQYAGAGVMAADNASYGRVYVGGSCRGVNYSN